MAPKTVKTACPYCGVGCGIVAEQGADGGISVRGDATHPANFGRLCSKGTSLAETLSLDERLLHPTIDGVRVPWDSALDRIAQTFQSTVAQHGPDSVAFYVSGQILTEDYYVANKLMKGFIGSGNIDTNSRLCMASSVAGHRRAFGTDTVPGSYEDLEQADLVVLVGSNLAWCHPVLFQRLEAARTARGTHVIVVDPRETATCAIADMHLPIKPGSDVALFNGLLVALADKGMLARSYIEAYTSGLDGALATARLLSLADIAQATGLEPATLSAFYALFARTEKAVTVYSQGVNQATSGTDKVNAIINCHLATGRIGRPGMGPFSVTGQPNAMGGRETGGLATMLAAHMDIENAAHRALVQRFWKSPRIADKPGAKAVDLFRAVADGRIKALWIMATNPVDSMPEADTVRAALQRCPFVVVSDVVAKTDTTAWAHVLLPSLAWGEKSGTVTNSERRISRQRSFLTAPGEARADWWQLAEVGKRMGFAEAFDYAGPHAVFAEYARLTAEQNDGTRDLDLGGVSDLDDAAYDALEPFQWPRAHTDAVETRFFAEGGFYTPDRRGRFVATRFAADAVKGTKTFPLVLNTGRIRDQWHTMTRTAMTPRLMSHIGEPYVEMHPDDARQCGVHAAELAEITSPHGTLVARVMTTARQQAGSVFVPMHWTDQFASCARVDALVRADVDPISGQPGLKQSLVAVAPYRVERYGLAVMRARPQTEDLDYWALARVPQGWRLEFALTCAADDPAALLATMGADIAGGEVLAYADARSGRHRAAVFTGASLAAAVFVAPEPVAVSRGWAAELLQQDHDDRLQVLAGRGGAGVADRGPIVCSCFDVGRKTIADAAMRGCRTVAAIGEMLSAGTNCGSCRSEIATILKEIAHAAPLKKAG